MIEVKLSDLYNSTQINVRNNSAWISVMKQVIDKYGWDEDIIIDCSGVDIGEVWKNDGFKRILDYDNILFRVYNNKIVADKVEALCISNGYREDRVENIVSKKDNVIPIEKKEKEVDKYWISVFEGTLKDVTGEDGEIIYKKLDLADSFDVAQIGQIKTVNSLFYVIEEEIKRSKCTSFKINMYGVMISSIDTIIESIYNNVIELKEKYSADIELINVEDKDVKRFEVLDSQIRGFNNNKSIQEKIELIRKNLKQDEVGLLCRYRGTRRVDKLGRKGDGEILWCKVAVLRGKKGNKLLFEVYNKSELITEDASFIKFDEEKGSVKSKIVEVKIDELGVKKLFTGAEYHFCECVQYDKNEYVEMPKFNADRSVGYDKLSYPELVEKVFNCYGIKYNKACLERDIKKSAEILNKEI